jgi:septal ring factor EnvC (AmiA/AmiB activator)
LNRHIKDRKKLDRSTRNVLSFRKSLKTKIFSTTMKQLFTTKLSKGLIALAVVVGGIAAVSPMVFAQSFQDQISQIDAQIQQYQGEVDRLRAEGDTLQNKLAIITAEKNTLQAEIDKNESQKKQLEADITANEEKLERQKRTLNKTVAQIYANGDTTPIVMLASSKNVGEYVSAQAVRGTVRDQMKNAMDQVKTLKAELSQQKTDVENLIVQQLGQREQIAAKEKEQADILEQTRGQEAAYGNMVGSLKDQRAAAEAALAASLARASYRNVAPAGYVQAGDVVGLVGSTGMSTGPHLHLEARNGGGVTDPSAFIQTSPLDMPPGWVSQSYGNVDSMYYSGRHPGVDYAAQSGTPIYAIAPGMMYRGSSESLLGTWAYGNVAIVELNNGVRIIYAHMLN